MKKFFYRVSNNDTIISISNKLKVPALRIVKLNNLNSEVYEGDLLYLERIEKSNSYIVKPFDTLETISKTIKKDILDICSYNCIDNVYFGQIIFY